MKQFLAGFLFVLLGASFGLPVFAGAPSDVLQPGQSLGIYMGMDRLSNLRDLGGYTTLDGRFVVRGKVYRSNEFFGIDEDYLIKLQQLQLKSDVDLRTPAEISAQPDKIPTGVKYIQLNVMADENLIVTPAQIDTLFKDPKLASKKMGGVEGVEASFFALYRDFVLLPSAQKSYRTLFLSLLNTSNVPVVFHCTNGKDRTGWATAALLTLLGVSKEEVLSDYLRSNEYLLPLHQNEIDRFISNGGDSGIPAALFGVKRKYLEVSFDEMHRRYGTIEEYFAQGLSINTAQQEQLRKLYLVRDRDL
ncbi:tyrosine-protein phosphatase [Polynucleobacter sp. 39-46-10]|uniref:tyrosine-protein phosphatase n=2 Tax=unclassified Polynucleobacter TaxID=2640945 RepID=UPI0025F7581E|nr:tyrosine-protein phosphatase [Polynucleobacter sp. 39-46-10]